MPKSIKIVAEIAPAAPQSAVVRSGTRSGVRTCKASRIAEDTITEIATT